MQTAKRKWDPVAGCRLVVLLLGWRLLKIVTARTKEDLFQKLRETGANDVNPAADF